MVRRASKSPLPPAIRLHAMKLKFRVYIALMIGLVIFMTYLGGTAFINNHYRNLPSTETIGARVDYTKRDCLKSGCYYDSYGSYTIDGKTINNVKVAWLTPNPVTTSATVLVSPARPAVAMPYYFNPYPREMIMTGIVAIGVLIWSLIITRLYRKSRYKLEQEVVATYL